uniref:Neurotransmitter-gated ion-channel ligand-binding domain-containing protein n=1 Tax=Panagrolaimus superbus TaxID=310955 RepID=A0A914ZBA1_9BILA
MDILFSQIWHDPGLNFENEEGAQCLTNLSLSFRMVDSIWLPNVCLVNSKSSSVHSSPTPNIFLAILPNGTVWTNYRVQLESPCDMDFTTVIPMDRVVCQTTFESYSFNVGKVRLHWKRQGIPVEIIGNINLPDFVLTHYVHEKNTFEYPAGTWDQVSYVKGIDVFMFGCVGYIFLSIVELAMVGALEKKENQVMSMDSPEEDEDDSASYTRRSFQKKAEKTKHRLRRMESPSTGSTDWKNSMWSKLHEGSTFIECPQPIPPSSTPGGRSPEAEELVVPGSPDSQSSKPSAFKFRQSARAVMWMKKSIRKKPPKPQAPKLFDKWSGEDLDV